MFKFQNVSAVRGAVKGRVDNNKFAAYFDSKLKGFNLQFLYNNQTPAYGNWGQKLGNMAHQLKKQV